MAEVNNAIEGDDLEDGEIESDSENQTEPIVLETKPTQPKPKTINIAVSKEKEKLMDQKDNQKRKKDYHKNDKNKNNREKFGRKPNYAPPVEDDIALNMEKALRKVLKKGEHSPIEKNDSGVEDFDGHKKYKKRKKRENFEKDVNRKRRKQDKAQENEQDEVDEDEMMFVRGASPVQKELRSLSPFNAYHSDDHESYGSDESSQSSREPRSRFPRRRPREFSERKGKLSRRRDGHPLQDPDGVCLYFMQGKCHKGDDCVYSHDAQPPRKMELCKFYLMDCCAKRDKCLYMHSDFPCKYFHTGIPCPFKDEDCKFAHGKPLSEQLKTILLKHIETAPKEILGDFPRLSRDNAVLMVATTQAKLNQQYSTGNGEVKEKTIPSLFELNIPKPAALDELENSDKLFQTNNEKHHKGSKVRQSRWCDSSNNTNVNSSTGIATLATQNILNIHNLSNVLTPALIAKLNAFGVEDLNQLSQLTVMQLNQIGLTMAQINEIQLNTLNIQKFGLINSNNHNSIDSSINAIINPLVSSKDLDMRIAPNPIPDMTSTTSTLSNETSGQDIDMRFSTTAKSNVGETDVPEKSSRTNKDSIDIDQYTQDALNFGTNDTENCEIYKSDNSKPTDTKPENKTVIKDVDHRVLQYVQEASRVGIQSTENEDLILKSSTDVDIRIPTQQLHNSAENKIIRRSTTDEDDDNLQIDEKWYSSDEDHTQEESVTYSSPKVKNNCSPSEHKLISEPTSVLNQLGDLSKIDISAEVTMLLSSLKNNSVGIIDLASSKEQLKPRDPRSLPKKSPEHKPAASENLKSVSIRKSSRISIYECIDGETTDDRKRIDVDLRQTKDHDFRMSSFGDTDLRQTPGSGDIDLRLALPFKPIVNHTPATEINGSIATHPPITYKLYCVDIPRPNYVDIKNSTLKSQASTDPRLRKLFRLSVDEIPVEPDKIKPLASIRADPRTRRKDSSDTPETPKQNTLDLQVVIQTSSWYKELSSNQKILVNQHLANVSTSLKKFHQNKTPGKTFDLTQIHSNNILHSIFSNLGISLDDKGYFSYSKNQDGLVGNKSNFGPSGVPMEGINMLGMAPGVMGHMGSGNLGNVNIGAMGMNNIGPMGNVQSMGFDPRFTPNNNRNNQPGLLGIAPNIPHNYDGGGFNGMQNFPMDNNFNNNYNGPVGNGNMNDFNSNNDFSGSESENYYRSKKNDFGRGNYRSSRGSERRGRGSSNRGGGRERRNYNDRGSWKADRR